MCILLSEINIFSHIYYFVSKCNILYLEPSYFIIDDVIRAVRYALQNTISVTVKSSGHEYVGRSAGDGSLNINMMKMNKIEINENDDASPTGASIKVGTGNNWKAIYFAVSISFVFIYVLHINSVVFIVQIYGF